MGCSREFDEALPAVPDGFLSRVKIQVWASISNLDLPSLLPPSLYPRSGVTSRSYGKAGRVCVV
jgi:hypothetical protein